MNMISKIFSSFIELFFNGLIYLFLNVKNTAQKSIQTMYNCLGFIILMRL